MVQPATVLLLSLAMQFVQFTHSLEVHVTAPDGKPLSLSAKVEVLDLDGIPIAETYSNRGGGVAEFPTNFAEGTYKLRISGPGLEPTTSQFDIFATESKHREVVRVRFADVPDPNAFTPGAAPTISARALKVPDKARSAFERAMRAYHKGEMQHAESAFQQAIAAYPHYADAHNNLGVLYLRIDQKSKAHDEFVQALADDPKLVTAYVNLAKISISNKNFRAAEADLDQAIAVDASALNAAALLTSTAYANGEFDKALATARAVHALPHHEAYADVHLVAGEILLQKKQSGAAISEYQWFLRESPDDRRAPQVRSLLAKLQSSAAGH